MEWRQQSSVSCADAFIEAQRWIEEVTGKHFGCDDFRAALENGVLLCDLINRLKPGIIKRVNRLSTPIAGLDNVNVFLKACGKLGLNVSQLFDPGDLQDLSTRATLRQDESKRRLKNVLITIYWLGRKAHLDAFYSGPQLNFKAFEGLLGLALSKALDEGSNVYLKDSWYPEREECLRLRPGSKMGNSADSIDSLDARTLQPNSEGCGSDAEAEQVFKMETTQLLKNKGHIPPPLLWRKQRQEENGRGCPSPLARTNQIQVRPERPVQVNPGWIWSKSLSDIPMVYPVRKGRDGNGVNDGRQDTGVAKVWNKENDHKGAVAAKDSEAQWQDDLTKWKNRRRSTKSDLRRKSQDREHVMNQMVNGALSTFEKEEAGGLLKSSLRDHQSPRGNDPAPRPSSTSPPSKSLCSDQEPRTRALLTRSYATEVPISPHKTTNGQGSTAGAIPASDGNILIEETHFASLASDGARVTTPSPDYPFSSQTQVKAQASPAPLQPTSELAQADSVFTNQISTLITTIQPNKTAKSTSTKNPPASMSSHKEFQLCTDPKALTSRPDAVNQAGFDTLEDHQNHKSLEENEKTSSEPAVEQGRGQQAAGVYKYLSRIGSWSRSASLPRGYRRSEGSSRLSSAITARPFGTNQSRVSSLPRLCNVEDNRGLLLESEKGESLCPPFKSLLKRQSATAHLPSANQASIKQKTVHQAKHNGAEQVEEAKGPALSSQTSCQTNGLNLQTHQNKSLPVHSNPSTDQPKVDHSDMRVSLTLKPNGTPDFGFQTRWDSTGARVKVIQPGSPAELCQLRVDDEIVAVNGVPVAHMNYSQWKDKITSSLQTGSLTMDICRYGNKDWSRREGSHHTQPGQSRVTLDLTTAASILIGCPDHSANTGTSTETAVRRVSKFNGPTDNVVQSKVMNGELADNHRTAKSEGGSESAISDLQVPSLSPSSSRWSWDREEDRRRQEKWQEEQERLLQEQYQRDQERMEAEWRRTQQDAMVEFHKESEQNTFEMTNGVESHASTQLHTNGPTNKTRVEQSPDRDELKEAGMKRPAAEGGQNEVTEQTWTDDSCSFAQLSPAHRTKSLSTPALAGTHKQIRGEEKKRQTLSKVELERQQILEEMKKRTQLLTDNSWIRQRSSSTVYKEPIYAGVPLKRFESLDNLDTLRQSSLSTATFSYPRPHSAAAGYCVPTRNSSSRYSTGATLSQRSASMHLSHPGRMVSGRRTCCMCECVLSGGAAMVIEALSLCFHLACFQCVGCHRHLGGAEIGVQVRILKCEPYCEPCYFQLKCKY